MNTLVEADAPPTTSRAARWGAARRRPLLWISLGVLVAAFGLRVWIIRGPLGSVNADEAVTGLMARALLDGNFSTFYWQQQYGGTVEIIPFAVLVAAIGDRAAIVVLPLLESLIIGWLLFVVARRRLGGQLALATVALAAVFPAASVWFTTRAMLFYQPVIIAGLGALVLAEQLAEDDVDTRGRVWRWIGLGFLLGVGWWASTQVLFFAIPVVVWLVVRRAVHSWSGPMSALGGFVVGASPWLLHNIRTEGGSLRDLPGGQGSYVDHLQVQVEAGWPMSVGLRRPFDERWVLEGWGWPLAIAAIVVAGAVVVAFARHRRIRSPLALVLVCFPLVHALAPSSYYVGTGRYYLFIMPAISYAIVAALSTIGHAHRWVGVVLVGATVMTGWTLHDLREVRPGPLSTEAVADALLERDIEHVYSDYWAGYMLSWENDEIIVSPYIFDRRPDWSAEVRAAADAAYVFDLSSATEQARSTDLIARLTEHVGITEEFDVGPFHVVVPARNVPPELLPAASVPG